MVLLTLDDSSVHRRVQELEQELVEFQESSKELEQALEEELRDLESRNAVLASHIQEKDAKIVSLAQNSARLTAELNEQSAAAAEQAAASEKTIAELKRKLVHMEILNEDMLSQDRVLENKYHLTTQFNNELLEKLALVENELELERRVNAQNRLLTYNQVQETRHDAGGRPHSVQGPSAVDHVRKAVQRSAYKSGARESLVDGAKADETMLDIAEMLTKEPRDGAVPRSESLKLLHELNSKSDVLRQKVDAVNMSLALQLSDAIAVARAALQDDAARQKAQSSVSGAPKKSSGKQELARDAPPTRKRTTIRGLVRGILCGTA
ncbi:hypothetical protein METBISCDRAFT_28198 [Metschnikowia bicuspidata]|uniref:NUDE domain-containing protein n=1 Tax=Metschnikowia bicuspidata TaxID=27322 RepID=A0A4P9Z9T0_9ASCO|nr:hypothetical protein METBISCDRAFT_28198 [Metschnikowia bicuspidata]